MLLYKLLNCDFILIGTSVEFKNYFSKFGATKAKLTFNRQTGLSRKFGFVTVESKEVYNEIFSRSDHFLEGSFVSILINLRNLMHMKIKIDN